MDKEEEERLENKQYMQVVDACRELFKKKLQDYGAAWRILRPASVTDQIYIKVARIRSLQLSGENLVGDSIESEFIGIVNYGIIGLIQFEDGFSEKNDTPIDLAEKLYDSRFAECFNVMKKKNHDYGEAWRNMRVETITDLILTKVFRTKQIEEHDGQTIASEGIPANYIDMVNYAIFALCLLQERPVSSTDKLDGEKNDYLDKYMITLPHVGEKVFVKEISEWKDLHHIDLYDGKVPSDDDPIFNTKN